jgi:5-methylcytosine-specific restriction endonuclease McrA
MKRPSGPGLFDDAPDDGLIDTAMPGFATMSNALAGVVDGISGVAHMAGDQDNSGIVLTMGSLRGEQVSGGDPRAARPDASSEWQVFDRRSGGKELTTAGDEGDIDQRYRLDFTVSEAVMAKIEKVKSLMSGKHPVGVTLEGAFETMIDEYIERHCPERRHERREKRSAKQVEKNVVKHKRSRSIPAKTKDAVYKRDGGRCVFVGTGGKRCNSIWSLQIDHIEPFAHGGGNTKDNLRLLCGRHNRFAAERVYGKDFMENHYKRE